MRNRSTSRILGIDIDIKVWLAHLPSVEEARPGKCHQCGAASRTGGAIGLHGHGLRERQVRGPLEPGGEPRLICLWLRRYLCTSCKATMTVGPKALRVFRLFSAPAIALALALWAVAGHSAPAVRAAVNPLGEAGAASARTWVTLRRWAADARRLFSEVRPWPDSWPPRKVAERVACAIASLSPGRGALPDRAFNGAVRSC